jgi:hypothetical protein
MEKCTTATVMFEFEFALLTHIFAWDNIAGVVLLRISLQLLYFIFIFQLKRLQNKVSSPLINYLFINLIKQNTKFISNFLLNKLN